MDLKTIPTFHFEEEGVSFKYLVFRLKTDDQEESVVRGVNFRPYEHRASERILQGLREELRSLGFGENTVQLDVDGGGSVSVNPYDETVVVFGEAPEHGAESDREWVAERLGQAFPHCQINTYQPGETEEPPKKKPVRAVKAAEMADDDSSTESRAGEIAASAAAKPAAPEGDDPEEAG